MENSFDDSEDEGNFSENPFEENRLTENVKAAVIKALNSLARTEQCRASLERKLAQKDFCKEDISVALDYLEERNFLSDERYASLWVRSHCSLKSQGKIRLMNDLLSRGVKKSVAEKAINEYLEQNPEIELCRKAYKKCVKQGKTSEKILKSLAQSGFSYNMIQKVLRSEDNYAAE